MAHFDPTVSVDTLKAVTATELDTAAEGADAWILVIVNNELRKVSPSVLTTIVDTLMEEAGEVHSHV